MQPDKQAKLEDELAKARKAERAYDDFVKPFVDARLKLIFDEFSNAEQLDTERLAALHRMSITVRAFEAEIQAFITTGKMAAFELQKLEE